MVESTEGFLKAKKFSSHYSIIYFNLNFFL